MQRSKICSCDICDAFWLLRHVCILPVYFYWFLNGVWHEKHTFGPISGSFAAFAVVQKVMHSEMLLRRAPKHIRDGMCGSVLCPFSVCKGRMKRKAYFLPVTPSLRRCFSGSFAVFAVVQNVLHSEMLLRRAPTHIRDGLCGSVLCNFSFCRGCMERKAYLWPLTPPLTRAIQGSFAASAVVHKVLHSGVLFRRAPMHI